MTRLRFYIGTTNADGPVSHDGVRDELLTLYGGYSATRVEGAWTDDRGHPIFEESVVYEILTDEQHADFVADRASALAHHARQQSVLWTCESDIQGGFANG